MKRLALLFAFFSPAAFALDFTGIQNWTGTGANEAALVIDFADSGPAYAWGYRFDGSATGYQMISAIAAADPALEIETTFYSGFGNAITGIRYGSLARGGFEPATPGFFGYFTADGTEAQPTSWGFAEVGVDGRVLADGSWDGHAWAPGFVGGAPKANVVAAAPVPEPATLLAVGLGIVGVLRRRRSA